MEALKCSPINMQVKITSETVRKQINISPYSAQLKVDSFAALNMDIIEH